MKSMISMGAMGCALLFGAWSTRARAVEPRAAHTAADSLTFNICVVDSVGDVGAFCGLAMDPSGEIRVTYLRADDGTLKQATLTGPCTWASEVVDGSGAVEGYCGLGIDAAGNSHVSYRRSDTSALWHAGPERGLNWAITPADNGGDVGRSCAAALDPGDNLEVVYVRADDATLKHATLAGATWNTEVVDASEAVEGSCGIAAGGPGVQRISYRRSDTSALWHAGPERGLNWAITTADNGGDVGRSCAAALAPGDNLEVAYVRADDATLKHATFAGATWNTEVVDASGAVEGSCEIAADGTGVQRISYRRIDTSALWHVGPERAPNWMIAQVDSKEDAGRFASIVTRSPGRIACAYYNFHENAGYGDVRVAELDPGSPWEFATVAETVGKAATDGVFTSLTVWTDKISGNDTWHVAFRAPEYGATYYATTDSVIFSIQVVSDTQDEPTAPRRHALYANYPNPFNPTTAICFDLTEPADVTLRVYDVSGRLVRTILNEVRVAGRHRVSWDGRDEFGRLVATGVYFYRIQAGSFMDTKRMMLLK